MNSYGDQKSRLGQLVLGSNGLQIHQPKHRNLAATIVTELMKYMFYPARKPYQSSVAKKEIFDP